MHEVWLHEDKNLVIHFIRDPWVQRINVCEFNVGFWYILLFLNYLQFSVHIKDTLKTQLIHLVRDSYFLYMSDDICLSR